MTHAACRRKASRPSAARSSGCLIEPRQLILSRVSDRPVTVSDTANWVAYYRALESERPDAIFHDPYARALAGERGERITNEMPRARQYGWPMVVRTAVMDG